MKSPTTASKIVDDEKEKSPEDNISFLLDQLNQRLLENSSLEKKFDTLMNKVEKIEGSQDEILKQLSSLNDAVYDPDSGLFSRIKEVKLVGEIKTLESQNSVEHLKHQQDNQKKK
jgi:hypothetical protein